MPNFTQHLCFLPPSSRSQSLKMVHAPHFLADTIEFTQQTCDQDSLSTAQSHMDEDLATQGVHSQDHSISSVSDENFKKLEEAQTKPILFMGNSSFGMNDLQVEKNVPMNQVQHAYVDHCFNGLYAAYGPQPMIQPHMVQIAPARVPLPLDLSEDGPVYVNAKQYHGILRRRQIRAKLEAQNKLVRNRRPYLHESRHKHAVNRVRGSGGRFLPSKTAEQSRASHSDCHIASREMILDHGFLWELRGNEGNHLGR